MEATYNITLHSISAVHKYLSKLQRRAMKAGQEVVFTFSFDDEVKTHKFEAQTDEEGTIIASYKYRVLRISQDITVHEGWTPKLSLML